jgi:DNA-binding protein HU-beta
MAVKGKKKVMNKAMLIDRLAEVSDEQKSVCKRVFEGFLDIVAQELKAGNEIAITGFGVFVGMHRKGRTGINPVTKKKMSIPAKMVPKFRAGKKLKEIVAG